MINFCFFFERTVTQTHEQTTPQQYVYGGDGRVGIGITNNIFTLSDSIRC